MPEAETPIVPGVTTLAALRLPPTPAKTETPLRVTTSASAPSTAPPETVCLTKLKSPAATTKPPIESPSVPATSTCVVEAMSIPNSGVEPAPAVFQSSRAGSLEVLTLTLPAVTVAVIPGIPTRLALPTVSCRPVYVIPPAVRTIASVALIPEAETPIVPGVTTFATLSEPPTPAKTETPVSVTTRAEAPSTAPPETVCLTRLKPPAATTKPPMLNPTVPATSTSVVEAMSIPTSGVEPAPAVFQSSRAGSLEVLTLTFPAVTVAVIPGTPTKLADPTVNCRPV